MLVIERLDDTTIVHVTGDLDVEVSPELGSILTLVQRTETTRIVVSLQRCNFCDASGLSVLLRAHNAATSDFVVVVPDGAKSRRVFEVTGLCKILHLVPTMERALAAELPLAV